MNSPVLAAHRLGIRLEVRVTARAKRNAITGTREGRLVVQVTAPPVDDAANAAVVEMVSKALRLPKRDVTIVAGEHSRQKSIAISGITADEVRHRLSAILAHSN